MLLPTSHLFYPILELYLTTYISINLFKNVILIIKDKMNIIDFILQTVPCSLNYDGDPMEFGQLQLMEQGPCRSALSKDGKVKATLRFTMFDTVATEWTIDLENLSEENSAIIDRINYCDLQLQPELTNDASRGCFPKVHYAFGSNATYEDFRPMTAEGSQWRYQFSSPLGRSSSETMPYFNLQLDRSHGAFLAIGWSGSWTGNVKTLRNSRGLEATFSMVDARFYLKPLETLTLPSMLLMPWSIENPGSECKRAYTAFRRFMRDYIAFRREGKLVEGLVCLRAWGGFTPEKHTKRLQNIKKFNMPGDVYAIDAGWNGHCDKPSDSLSSSWFQLVGDWVAQKGLYPNGLAGLAKEARDTANLGFSAWFEMERASSGTHALADHPDYFLKYPNSPQHLRDHNLVDLGRAEPRHFLTSALAKQIEATDMDLFRIDFNIPPMAIWQANDEPDRQGITEIYYINGLYKLLDDLLARFPKLIFDNCASGGRRLDYQMCRRSIPIMCRSDYFCNGFYDFQPLGTQLHTLALSRWLPLHSDSFGSCTCLSEPRVCMDTYFFRSSIGSGVGMPIPERDLSDAEGAWYRKMLQDAFKLRPYMALDFNPLTGYSTSLLDWCAYQLFDDSHGAIFAFRRDENNDVSRTFALEGIDPKATYILEDLDGGSFPPITGEELAQGLTITIPEQRASKVILYSKNILFRN